MLLNWQIYHEMHPDPSWQQTGDIRASLFRAQGMETADGYKNWKATDFYPSILDPYNELGAHDQKQQSPLQVEAAMCFAAAQFNCEVIDLRKHK